MFSGKFSTQDVLYSLNSVVGKHILIQENPVKYAYYGKLGRIYEFPEIDEFGEPNKSGEGNAPKLSFSRRLIIYDPNRSGWLSEKKDLRYDMYHYVSSSDMIWQVGKFTPYSLKSIRIPFDPEEFKERFPSHKFRQLFPSVPFTSI